MKKLWMLAWILVSAGMCTSIGAQDFDAKLKRFITITNNKYTPEISRDEAIRLGFTVNDYNRFVEYVGQLNVKAKRSLTLPQNRFLNAFVEIDPDDGTLFLNIPLEKAIRAGGNCRRLFSNYKSYQGK